MAEALTLQETPSAADLAAQLVQRDDYANVDRVLRDANTPPETVVLYFEHCFGTDVVTMGTAERALGRSAAVLKKDASLPKHQLRKERRVHMSHLATRMFREGHPVPHIMDTLERPMDEALRGRTDALAELSTKEMFTSAEAAVVLRASANTVKKICTEGGMRSHALNGGTEEAGEDAIGTASDDLAPTAKPAAKKGRGDIHIRAGDLRQYMTGQPGFGTLLAEFDAAKQAAAEAADRKAQEYLLTLASGEEIALLATAFQGTRVNVVGVGSLVMIGFEMRDRRRRCYVLVTDAGLKRGSAHVLQVVDHTTAVPVERSPRHVFLALDQDGLASGAYPDTQVAEDEATIFGVPRDPARATAVIRNKVMSVVDPKPKQEQGEPAADVPQETPPGELVTVTTEEVAN